MEGDLTKPQPGHGSRRRPRAGATARVCEPPQNVCHLSQLWRHRRPHGRRQQGARLWVHFSMNLCWSCPWPGLRVSYTSLTSSKASTPFPEALAAMGYCQIAQNCQTGLQTHLASGKQSREHRQRASGHVPPRVLGRYRHKGGAPLQYPAPLHSPARTHCCAGHPCVPPQLGLRGTGHWAGHSGGCETGPAGGTVPRLRLKSMPPAPQESR